MRIHYVCAFWEASHIDRRFIGRIGATNKPIFSFNGDSITKLLIASIFAFRGLNLSSNGLV